jgi:hypothetical protein
VSAVEPRRPGVVDGAVSSADVVEWVPAPDHPLAGTAVAWVGPLTVDEARQIHARVVYGELPWWRRVYTAAPAGWTS